MEPTPGVRRVQRSTTDRWVGGVAGGIAAHLGVPTWTVRLVFAVMTIAGGMGAVTYLLMWAFLPLEQEPLADADAAAGTGGSVAGAATPGSAPAGRAGAGPARAGGAAGGWDIGGVLGLLSLALGVLLALSALGAPIKFSAWAPLLLFAAGVVVLWRQSDDSQRTMLRARAQAGVQATALVTDRMALIRILVGLGLVAAGVVGVVGPRVDLWTGLRGLAAAGAVVAGLALIALPWVSAWIQRMQAERYAAVRAEERAAMAARVHDSVLQTLTLIQRRADDPREVTRLARAEERALRSWLYAPSGRAGSLGAALSEMATAAEVDFDARIELVTVGDVVVDDRLAALVAATREAVVNVAKHADAPATVYAEVADDHVEVNVKDRGRGFDLAAIEDDRHGVRESIVARLAAVGGTATIRTAPGEGTEVRLLLPIGAERG